MIRALVTLCLLFSAALSRGQEFVYMKAIGGTYRMSDMKRMQDELLADLSPRIPARAVRSFPASVGVELGIDFAGYDDVPASHRLGGFTSYILTQGKISYSDYSGEVDIEQDLTRITLGTKGTVGIAANLSLVGKLGFCLSRYEINSRTSLDTAPTQEEEVSFTARGVAVEPGLQWSRTWRRVSLIVEAGYELNINGKTQYDSDRHLIDDAGDPLKIDWSGIRLGTGIVFGL